VSSLIRRGYSRDKRGDCPQIVYGLLCDVEGRPIAVKVFSGNTSDPTTFSAIVQTVRKRFGIERVIFVGDRGMITSARIREDLRPVEGLDWISALRSDGIRKLLDAGLVQHSLFDEQELAEIVSDDFPNERLVVCRNPLLADERSRKREALLAATEAELEPIRRATLRPTNPLRGQAEIGLRVGKVIGKYKMKKHFEWTIEEDRFTFARDEENIQAEKLLDGLYVVRTSLGAETMGANQVVQTYKSLSRVERAFRSIKTVDLKLRPIHHRTDDRIRSHVFLCMLAYYVEWHMREKLQEVLFDDCEKQSANASRQSPVSPAARSQSAREKDCTRETETGCRVQSFQDMLSDMATLTRNRIRVGEFDSEYDKLTTPTAYQRRVLELLNVTL
jgi:transposase